MKISITAKMKAAQSKMTSKVTGFLKDERSAKEYSNEGYLMYAGIIIGIIALLIVSQFMDVSFNDIGNFFSDGVNGDADEVNLKNWSDATDGFNKK